MNSTLGKRLALVVAVALVVIAPSTAGAAPARLLAGVGQADITPPKTGYYLGGWTRADRLALGQSTRLFANTLVLQRGTRKFALVDAELFAVTEGMTQDVAHAVADLGFDKTGILLQGDHTHSGPGGFANNPVYNTAAPSLETIDDPASFVNFINAPPADKQLYTFLVNRIAMSIRRADADRAPAAAGWGHADLYGLTQNRSLEAHLLDHGVHKALGEGTVADDPLGYNDTIDPNVDLLRVDKLERKKGKTVHVPIGAWSTFADHGTVVHSELGAYSGDHQASAWRIFTARVRREGHVPASQNVVDVFPNSDEGDQTAGIAHVGPAAANYVGSVEASKMYSAWKKAGKHLSKTPALDVRWTRTCFCGATTATGKVASNGVEGAPFLTGSEEGRGPLYDITGVPFEGLTNPITDPVQGNKIAVPIPGPPPAVPISVWRIGDGAIAAMPGEPTKEVGTRVRGAVLAATKASGVRRVVIGGLAGDYIQYITTPQEYPFQSYEAGSTLYGQSEATFFQERLVDLATRLVAGTPAPAPYALDPSYGIHPDGPKYAAGAASGSIVAQPAGSYQRLGHPSLSWKGGPSGADRPLDAPFVTAQRKTRGRWHSIDNDLGVDFLWRVDSSGRYDAKWEVPLDEPVGTYRLVVTATRYRLESQPFAVTPATSLRVEQVNGGTVRLDYPQPIVNVDLTSRPVAADGGSVSFAVGGHKRVVTRTSGTGFLAPGWPSNDVSVPAGAAHDRYGNTNAAAFSLG
jgi:hypothetical protein